MELEIVRTIVIGALCVFFFVGWMLSTLQNQNLKDENKALRKANKRLYEENLQYKAKLSCIGFYKNEEKENKKVGKK